MSFAPWTPGLSASKLRSPDFLALLTAVAERDLRRALTEKLPANSTSEAGKTLARLATLLWVIKDVVNSGWLLEKGLPRFRADLARYVANEQRPTLYYDDSWKGIVSSAGFTDPAADSGNTYYTAHRVSYASFVYSAAVMAYLEPEWLEQGDNKAWTNMLVKTFAESDYEGRDYPFQRCFDWWHGHSWEKGLQEAPDGKQVVATSEDGFAAFAEKIWGKVSGDANMEKRGNVPGTRTAGIWQKDMTGTHL